MKKVIVILLIVGLLFMGTCTIAAAEEQEGTEEIKTNFSEPTGGDPTPCGEGGDGGGPGGVPG